MYQLVSQISWNNVTKCDDVNESVEYLEQSLRNIFEISVPYKIILVTRHGSPETQ